MAPCEGDREGQTGQRWHSGHLAGLGAGVGILLAPPLGPIKPLCWLPALGPSLESSLALPAPHAAHPFWWQSCWPLPSALSLRSGDPLSTHSRPRLLVAVGSWSPGPKAIGFPGPRCRIPEPWPGQAMPRKQTLGLGDLYAGSLGLGSASVLGSPPLKPCPRHLPPSEATFHDLPASRAWLGCRSPCSRREVGSCPGWGRPHPLPPASRFHLGASAWEIPSLTIR